MWCYYIKGSRVILQLVKIANECCAALIMIEFVKVNAFGANFILVVVTAIGPFRNSICITFNVTIGKNTTLDSAD